uniref:Uncharacterized protein n=2 Tax=Solanum lycopersicum TaxID=4081 RepID=A0A3Q7ED00_SOLLC
MVNARRSPFYGVLQLHLMNLRITRKDGYNDFNTFYMQMYIRGALGVSEDITNIEDFFEVVDLG